MSKAVRYDNYGGVDVLQVVDVEIPEPGEGQARVSVRAAGINPGEAKIREGLLHDLFPATFPTGQGTDFAGVVDAVGPGVEDVAVGDEVIGWSDERSSHAEQVTVPAGQLVARPAAVPWEVAGALPVAGFTAWAAVRAVALTPADTVVVSGAAGGVGSLAVQLAKNTGATVIGLASEPNRAWLTEHGVVPVTYGEGVADRVRAAARGTVDALIDTYGEGYVDLAIELGVAPQRIDTIMDWPAAQRHAGVKTDANAVGASAPVLAELAADVAAGRLEVPIANTYPLAEVREAYGELASGHTRGKIVLLP
ncbi:MAG TPA: NADP-dependent oxidoreductase [Baekduia sp.]|jgi:NADPH:quinone reductase-like Zn-dependent oxidoreductase